MVALSTLYSYVWDLKFDWGFLQSGAKDPLLRDEIAYPHKTFYYTASMLNLSMRLSWILSIQYFNVFTSLLAQTVTSICLGIVECFRRSLWNYFRLEVEHLKTIESFNIVQNFELPFIFNIQMSNISMKKIIEKEFENAFNLNEKQPGESAFRSWKSPGKTSEERWEGYILRAPHFSCSERSPTSIVLEQKDLEAFRAEYLKNVEQI